MTKNDLIKKLYYKGGCGYSKLSAIFNLPKEKIESIVHNKDIDIYMTESFRKANRKCRLTVDGNPVTLLRKY